MANKSMTAIQRKVAQTILEESRTVNIGGREYTIAPPTIGTLILASELLSTFPESIKVEKGREFQDILSGAKDYKKVADLAAILILGAKKSQEVIDVKTKKKGRIFSRSITEKKTRREVLREHVLLEMSPSELRNLIVPLFEGLQLNDFFVITTFLTGINANVTKPTKVEKATASGRS